MKWLKITCLALAAAAAIFAGLVWLYPNPVGPIAGRALTGEEQPYPVHWGFTNNEETISLETRPENPYSVTTYCFLHEGELYVPADSGSEKRWTAYVLEDPRVRLKVGDDVFAARARRVEGPLGGYLSSLLEKYQDDFPDGPPLAFPPDLWLFRIEAREG
ncbi:MAG: hypothetical protein OXU92_06495 [Deltaproteobacteria bacterium]|nr:hypothetical protein [Deltaproteobacteria bacterium]